MAMLMPALVGLAALSALSLYVSPAHAQLSRTYVSAATGSDANNCDRPTPCRTFQAAHDKTNDLGEITVLDPGGYGGVAITKSISIVNDGVGEASILVSGGVTGITVNAGAAAYVNLRGITIQGIGFGGGTGLSFNSGFSLVMTNCVIRNHTRDGIYFSPNVESRLALSNILVSDNGRWGILIVPSGSGAVKAALNRVRTVHNSVDGILVQGTESRGTINVVVADSIAANNANAGVTVFSRAGNAPTNVTVLRSVVANNGSGLFGTGFGLAADGAFATLRLGTSAVTGNTIAWFVAEGGIVQSYGDNNIDGNGDDRPGLPTIANK